MLMGPLPVEEGSSVEKDELVAQIDNRTTLAKQKIARVRILGGQGEIGERRRNRSRRRRDQSVASREYQMNLDIQK